MTTRLITPASVLAVSVADARANMRIDGTDQDALIEAYLWGIISHAEHYTGRSFMQQTWKTTLDSFPDAIRLDHPPIGSVTSITYLDADGVEQTLDPADYIVDRVSEPGYIVPAYGARWPETYCQVNAVNVTYVAGYGATDASTPREVRLYVLATLAAQFDPAARPERGTVQNAFTERLLDPVKIWSMG